MTKDINNKKYNKKTKKGGAFPGTSGSIGTLVLDIVGTIENSIKAIVSTVDLAVEVIELPGDLYVDFTQKNAPGSNSNPV